MGWSQTKWPSTDIFFTTVIRYIETTERNKRFFHDAYIGYGSALWASWHFTCVSPTNRTNPMWARHMRPLRLPDPLFPGPDPCCRLQRFGAARPWLRLSLGLGAHGARSHIHPAVTVGGPQLALGSRWLPCIPCPLGHHRTAGS